MAGAAHAPVARGCVVISVAFTLPRGGLAMDVQFEASFGITALFGPSGSGKTTILQVIAGLQRPASGRIAIAGDVLFDASRHINQPPHHRRIGYVFQDALLFPHLSVEANLRYGARSVPAGYDAVVQTLGIGHLLKRRPATLSGGERQRVAIGRAVFSGPRLLLMDEPLAALDTDRKQEILPLIESLRDGLRLPILYVSHAVDEVARLADTVLVLDRGRIVRQGPPQQVLSSHLPQEASRFERVSVLTATATTFDPEFGLTALRHPAGIITVAGHLPEGALVRLPVLATDVALATAPPEGLSIRTALHGSIAAIETSDAATVMVDVSLAGGQTLAAAATRKAIAVMGLQPGTPIWCLIKSVAIDERWLRQAQASPPRPAAAP
jgi:molybdate transport system ATP-binding protein